MYELCNLLAIKKIKAPRKPSKKQARIGAKVEFFNNGEIYVIKARDEKYRNAFFLEGMEFSVSRDMFMVL